MNQISQLATNLRTKYSTDLFLGRLCWYSIPDAVTITHKEFVATLAKHNVPFGQNLPEIRAVDVFKRGAKAAERIKYAPSGTEKALLDLPAVCHINHLFRNSGQDKDFVYRSLMREVVDSSGHEIASLEIASLVYDRSAESIARVTKSGTILNVEEAIIQDVLDYFTNEAERITPYSIREFVRKGVEWNFHSVKVRPSGGVYFVQEQFATDMGHLEDAINEVGGSFHSLPLMDDSKQREMLKKAFEDESMDDISILMGEISEIMINNKTISLDRYTDFKVRYDKLITKVLEYSDVLDEAMATTSSYLELAEGQIKALMVSNVKRPTDEVV